MASIGPDAADAVPALKELLEKGDNALRIEVAHTLGEIGPAASETVPALVRMMDNPDFDIRQSASIALARIAPDGKGLGPALMGAIYNDDGAAADRLVPAIRRSGDNVKLVEGIRKLAADDPNPHIRATAKHVLELMSAPGK